MIRPITALTALLACGAGLYLYQSKHRAHVLDQKIEATVHQADTIRERIRMLHAEWTLLNRPDRLQRLADQFLSLEPTKPEQFVTETDLASRLPPVQIPSETPATPDGTPAAAPGEAEPAAGVPVAAAGPGGAPTETGVDSPAAPPTLAAAAPEPAHPAAPPVSSAPDRAGIAVPPSPHPQPVRLAATRPVPAHTANAVREDLPPHRTTDWQPPPRARVAVEAPPRPRPWAAPPPAPRYAEPRYIPARYHPPAYAARPQPVAYGAAYRAPPPPMPVGSLLGMAQRGAAPPPPAPMPIQGGSGG